MEDFDLFGEPLAPPPEKKKPEPKPKPEKKLTAKQLRMQAPAPKRIIYDEDEMTRAVRALYETELLHPDEHERFRKMAADRKPAFISNQLKEWRERHAAVSGTTTED